jgi:hypothetical protein
MTSTRENLSTHKKYLSHFHFVQPPKPTQTELRVDTQNHIAELLVN